MDLDQLGEEEEGAADEGRGVVAGDLEDALEEGSLADEEGVALDGLEGEVEKEAVALGGMDELRGGHLLVEEAVEAVDVGVLGAEDLEDEVEGLEALGE